MKDLCKKTVRLLQHLVGISDLQNDWKDARIAEERRAYCQIGVLSMDSVTSMYAMKEVCIAAIGIIN